LSVSDAAGFSVSEAAGLTLAVGLSGAPTTSDVFWSPYWTLSVSVDEDDGLGADVAAGAFDAPAEPTAAVPTPANARATPAAPISLCVRRMVRAPLWRWELR
jgi:hypothetical protein